MKRYYLAILAFFAAVALFLIPQVVAVACATIPIPSASASSSKHESEKPSVKPSASVSDTASYTPSVTPSASETPSVSIKPSDTPTESPTATVAPSSTTPSTTPSDVTISPMPGESVTPNPKPEPVITYTEWMWPMVCGAIVVTQSRWQYTTPWKADGDTYVPDLAHRTSVLVYRDHQLVGAEVNPFQSDNPDGYCYVAPVVTSSPSAVVTNVSTASSITRLPNTGTDIPAWMIGITFGACVVGAMILLFAPRYNKKD